MIFWEKMNAIFTVILAIFPELSFILLLEVILLVDYWFLFQGVNLAGSLPSNSELVERMEFVNWEKFESIFPFLMVSMKSGTSFYRVDSPT